MDNETTKHAIVWVCQLGSLLVCFS